MLVLITYDVNTTDPAGKKRLRTVAKKCVAHGQRVQNSVFECLLDAADCKKLQAELASIIDSQKDSLRFYALGNNYKTKIEHIGAKTTYAPEDTLMI
ncbi:MAG: CRISPR-associated endonuclease Cas2 [Clostridia bacterium]|nr:CRISPR-associated endonuclease Cas2 [Clostridia bacterium]